MSGGGNFPSRGHPADSVAPDQARPRGGAHPGVGRQRHPPDPASSGAAIHRSPLTAAGAATSAIAVAPVGGTTAGGFGAEAAGATGGFGAAGFDSPCSEVYSGTVSESESATLVQW